MIVITDANIFMHLIDADLLDSFFNLELEVLTTREIFEEMDEEKDQLGPYADINLLTIIDSTADEVDAIELFPCSPGLSFPDRTILYHAGRKQWMVLTGEKLMRNECEKNGLLVHGILWIMEELIGKEIIASTVMAEKLEALIQLPDFRVPKKECEQRIYNWRNT